MIAVFPTFSKLNLAHKQQMESITSQFETYSDFNFISLFCWDTDNSTEISILKENLVIKLPDYITGKPIYSLLGSSQTDDSLKRLLGLAGKLKLVPEVVIASISDSSAFTVKEDKANFDYIYSLPEHAAFPDLKYKGKRKKTNRFTGNYQGHYKLETLKLPEHVKPLLEIFEKWASAKKDTNDSDNEKKAITQLLDNYNAIKVSGLLLIIDDHPAGFTIYEPGKNGQAIWHFHKALPQYKNSDVFLTQAASKDLLEKGQTEINWEQDLGIPGLRKSKMSYHPTKFLKKYTVKLKE